MSRSDIAPGQRTVIPVGPFMREQILARLRAALRLAEGDLSSTFGAFRAALDEVVERADAVELTAHACDDAAPGETAGLPASRVTCAAFGTATAAAEQPVSAFLLIAFGAVAVDRPVSGEGFVFTRRHAESAKRWFDQIGRKLAIDYEHQSFDRLNTRADGLRPAAGWIGGLEVRDDGLWAVDVTWTEKAAELLRSGEYRYFSPVIFWTDEERADVAALGPVALTNDPAMRGVAALAATGAGLEADEAARADLLRAAQEEVESLRVQLADRDADAFVERGMSAGKIVASARDDWREDYLRNAGEAEARLARAPVVLPPGRVLRGRDGESSSRAPRRGGAAGADGSGSATEDLAAFERAVQAGRVLRARFQSQA